MKKSPPKRATRTLTVLLIRREFPTPESALKTPHELTETPLPRGIGFKGVLYTAGSTARQPRWVPFVEEAFPDGVSIPHSMFPAALLFLRASERWFAVTFGPARHLLKPESFEMDFGLKVTLNTVDEKKLRSLDVRTIEELTVHTRRQVSRSSGIDAFSIDDVRDLLGAVTGEPTDSTLAKRLGGRDSLSLTAELSFSELADKCEVLLASYESTHYQKSFAWVDNIRLIREPTTRQRLDDELLRTLNARDFQKVHLAPPEVIDWDGIGFLYPGESVRSADVHGDLDLEECFAAMAEQAEVESGTFELSPEQFKSARIRAVEASGIEYEKWPLYKCLVAELSSGDELHVLSAGQWFRIEKVFAARTLKEASAYVKELKSLPPAKAHQREDQYNEGAALGSTELVCLDKVLDKPKGARSTFETCDLFSNARQFIHVKKMGKSSFLSHLFSQGAVSAETFLRDEDTRHRFKRRVEAQSSVLAKMLGDPTRAPTRGEYEVVFAVIAKANRLGWPRALPFFSQLNFVRQADRLRTLGYKVALCRIDVRK
ncbi:hypothetical protein MEBOL_006403 [Melittangium boletus DSM 14713]|uniref:Sporadically distributed protein, TIGR04141 family n=2 Tax=Melittangium boletus TaxID=83453 RepID=A0A250IMF2_9BACT|nr:hypothetical protein MEBOL_006403 [Melittangium boletus DSM 14713]